MPKKKEICINNIDQLKKWERNPRNIDARALEGLQRSITEFGDLSGITYNAQLGALVCGHQRIASITEKWGDQVEIKDNIITLPTGDTFPIRIVYWDEVKHTAANIAANNPHIAGTYTDELALLMDDLQAKAPELVTGLNLDLLRIEMDKYWKSQEIKEDVAPPLPKKARTKPGDVYQLGKHRLSCGDSSNIDDINKLMNGAKARLVFTDPPYNVDYESATGKSYNSTAYGGDGSKIFNDKKTESDCTEFYTKVLNNIHLVTHDDGTIYWWYASRNQHINKLAFENSSWHFSQIIIWLKNGFVFSPGQEYHRCYEPCMLGWKKGKKHYSTKMFNSLTDLFSLDYQDFAEQLLVWYERRDTTNTYVHPTQKPVRLAERALKKNSNIGDIVIDCFGGSGSTLIGCEQMQRICYTNEMDPKFCDVIVTRYCNFVNDNNIILNGKEKLWRAE